MRLNIRKETLRQWRHDFAEALRAQGIAANATERAVRGVSKTHKKDAIYRAMRRGESTHFDARALAVARNFRDRRASAGTSSATLLKTRGEVERGWHSVGDLLEHDGDMKLASLVRRFVHQMPLPRTDHERMREQLLMEVRRHTSGHSPPTR
jgi:hypothetical protein